MKQLLFGLLITTMLFSFASCGNRRSGPSETGSNDQPETSNSIVITDQTAETNKTDETEMQGGEEYGDAANAIDDALEKMGLEYIALMLLHYPGTDDVKAYHAMEQAVADGKIRSIGLSNWYIEELETFLPQVTIIPAVVQNEIHPYYQEIDVVPYIQESGIVVEGWYPIGGRGYTKELLGDETISAIADTHA